MSKKYTREQLMSPDLIDSYPAPHLEPMIKQDVQLPHRFELFRAANLTDEEIRLVYLIAIEHLTFRQAADVVKIHYVTAHRKYHRALEKLRSTPEIQRAWDLYIEINIANEEE